MAIDERIQAHVRKLPSAMQTEVLDFVEYLLNKVERDLLEKEEAQWSGLSLDQAMRGMEDEAAPLYQASDLKVAFS